MRSIDVEYIPGDRVVGIQSRQPGTVRTVMASEGQRCYLVVSDAGPVLGWLEAHEIEPLTLNGQEVTP